MTQIVTRDDGKKYMDQDIKTGNGKILPVLKDTQIYPLCKAEISDFAREAGFTDIRFYADYLKTAFYPESQSLLVVIA